MKEFDIAVVGAGPGGSTAAKIAAEKGFSVALIEKQNLSKEGRYKACGGAVAWELIEEIHYPEEQIDRIIENLVLHHVDGSIFTKKGKGAVLWRSKLDFFLTKSAIKSGAQLFSNEPVKSIHKNELGYEIRTSRREISSKYVIAADGVTSPTLRSLNWPNFNPEDLVLTITKEMESKPDIIEKYLGKEAVHLFFGIKDFIPLGYAWLFPKSKTITVGWGNNLVKISNTRREFQKFLSVPLTTQVLENSHQKRNLPHLIPVGTRKILYQEGTFAVGDAGGFVDPISGKGIPYAMMSGEIAVKTLNYCLSKGKEEKMGDIYLRRLNNKFLSILTKKRELRSKIFQSDETLKQFLSLWEKHRSSEILLRNLLKTE